MSFLNRLNTVLSEDANEFAAMFNLPRISPWIIKQYNNGYRSVDDFKKIVDWVTNDNPSLKDFDFHSALKRAKQYFDDRKTEGFDPYTELHSNTEILDFEDGKRWIEIGREDCNAICHRLQYDCHTELNEVYNNAGKCYALQDPQDNTICIFILNDGEQFGRVIGQFNKRPKCAKEIRSLCVHKGLDFTPDAYEDMELAKALATRQLDPELIDDVASIMKRLNAVDIINSKMLKYAHHAPIATVYDLYCKTNHRCLLQYALGFLVSHNATDNEVYRRVKAAASQDPDITAKINAIQGEDAKPYVELMDDAASQIVNL
jgi:hypothetical protein